MRAATLALALLAAPAGAGEAAWQIDVRAEDVVAYLATPAAPARRVLLRCARGAPGFLDLAVADGWFFAGVRPPALLHRPFTISALRLAVDDGGPRTFNARYDRAARRYATTLATDDPLVERLMAGHRLELDEPLAPGVASLSLAGSRAAITPLLAHCR